MDTRTPPPSREEEKARYTARLEAAGWEVHVDGGSGDTFYFKTATEECQWERPVLSPPKPRSPLPRSPPVR